MRRRKRGGNGNKMPNKKTTRRKRATIRGSISPAYRRRRGKVGKKGGRNGSSSSTAGPGSWINKLSTRGSTLTPSQPSSQSSSSPSSTESDWFFQGQRRPGANLSGYGVGEDIQLLHGCEVANRSCDCVLPWKTGICAYDNKKRRIYCKCRGKQRAAEQAKRRAQSNKARGSSGGRRRKRRHRRTRKQRGGWFGSNWFSGVFGTWGKKTKKGAIPGSWTSQGMRCNPALPLQCPGGLKCVKSGFAIGPLSQGKCM